MRKGFISLVLFLVEAGMSNPGIGALMCEGPVEVPTGCRQCRRIGSVIPPFGEPACQIGRIGTGNVFIGKPAECAIRVLNAEQPPYRALGRVTHLLATRLAMPRRQPVEDLSGIEGRRRDPVIGDFKPRKPTFRQLHG